ncbi:MAG: MBL fold metallo-hydrolase [Cyclobacteriaceae bacterium]|nr:MBL fold metallo-hydrolase [Cyclobacteriaceae bacterium]
MLKIKSFVFNPFMENTYLLYDEVSKEGVVIDPGCYEDFEKREIHDFIMEEEIKVTKLINTHCHIDHVFGNYFIKETFNVPFYMHEEDLPTLRSVPTYAPNYGFSHYHGAEPDEFLGEGDRIKIGENNLDILFVPGHAPGHIALVCHEQRFCIGGDVLFQGSVGRTDLPGGDFQTLIQSIHHKLFVLDEDYVVYPGHGGTTTIGEEMMSNPFCALK